jgi:hypothetical protein
MNGGELQGRAFVIQAKANIAVCYQHEHYYEG